MKQDSIPSSIENGSSLAKQEWVVNRNANILGTSLPICVEISLESAGKGVHICLIVIRGI